MFDTKRWQMVTHEGSRSEVTPHRLCALALPRLPAAGVHGAGGLFEVAEVEHLVGSEAFGALVDLFERGQHLLLLRPAQQAILRHQRPYQAESLARRLAVHLDPL